MRYKKLLTVYCICFFFYLNAQQDLPQENLKEVIISSSRIDLPLSKNSRSIQIITKEEIKKSGVITIVDLLQQISGIDIRRRGSDGVQADLYIRGGTFDQTLLLIDGIKVEDSQTGHHTLNFLPPPEIIERIEIVKGPAARIFGQNAFSGAINIVTKKQIQKKISVRLNKGSFNRTRGDLFLGSSNEKRTTFLNVTKGLSDGYRHNTDYNVSNYFAKATFLKEKTPINIISLFSGRKFGANGFYANPSATEQYEETQASLLAFYATFNKKKWIIKPKAYWRRGQDMYEYIRGKPEIYRNLHITNKIGFAFDTSYSSSVGETGLGLDLSRVSISSNNLSNHQRTMINIFVEHRIRFFENIVDISPGFAVNYFSDFKWHIFPGLDMGIQLSQKIRLYSNIGYTYRIPTYTDLYYSDPTTLGNKNLKPEEAVSKELGIRFIKQKFNGLVVFYNRKSKNLIDYVKETEEALWQAYNIREVTTKGFDFEISIPFRIKSNANSFKISYSYLKNNFKNIQYNFSKYSINSSFKHQLTGVYKTKLFDKINSSLVYKLIERHNKTSYNLLDFIFHFDLKKIETNLLINNVFNIEYSETSLVPMPKRNALLGIRYSL